MQILRDTKERNTLIWGARSQGRIILSMIRERGSEFPNPLFFDPSVSFDSLDGVPVIHSPKFLQNKMRTIDNFFVAIGGEFGELRNYISLRLRKAGLNSPNLISTQSYIHTSVKLNFGIQIMPGVCITQFARLESDIILNTNSTVDHESELGNGVHIMGGACVTGRVKIGNWSTVGTNSTVLPDIEIGEKVFIGAGSVVTRDILKSGIYVGAPATRIRSWDYELEETVVDEIVQHI